MRWSNSYLGFDGFLKSNSKSKPKASAEDKAKKKQELKTKAKNIVDTLKTQYDKAGGVKGILETANNVKKFVKDDSPTTPDFDVNAGNKQTLEEEKKGVPVLVWVIGGVVVLVLGTFLVVHYKNGKQVPARMNTASGNNISPIKTSI